ncbi:hypothetical protein P175DRAFT_010174 [Aspergillus ochraceoroseus IBT 24754]|uniref:Uncharacterized protein n=1 Tax=Aspergillus ochraceoroseus IBT 24754 TaxID=1392256 RepID=A0A2T5M5V6_9EURO|nr:uncharacterized protein P175DRAFT_010174 [Aspergillus ochraceoroseus IBT 24754]PTU23911.1 hypothetical protein P175DRAFT_010174 [Aspergillus ochraceoroseus IBT 24754]
MSPDQSAICSVMLPFPSADDLPLFAWSFSLPFQYAVYIELWLELYISTVFTNRRDLLAILPGIHHGMVDHITPSYTYYPRSRGRLTFVRHSPVTSPTGLGLSGSPFRTKASSH